MVLAIGVALSRSPLIVIGTNSIPGDVIVEFEKGDALTCQQSGTLPRSTSAIRVALEARAVGPRVALKVMAGSRILTEGARAAGWGIAPTVTVPVRPVARTVSNALVCAAVGPTVEPFRVRGTLVHPTATEARNLSEVRLHLEYLRSSRESWWARASSIMQHMGLGHAASGIWLVFLAIALMLGAGALASRLVWDELR